MTITANVVIRDHRLSSGGHTLHSRSVRPAGDAWARLVLVHGYGEHLGRHLHFLRWLAERGVECHALDLRGHGLSQGVRGYVSRWEEYLDDFQTLLAQCDLSSKKSCDLPSFVLGHSHGALVVTAAVLERGLTADGVILTAPYFRSRMYVPRWKRLLAHTLSGITPRLTIPSGLRSEWMTSDAEMIRDSQDDPLTLHVATARWYTTMLQKQLQVLAHASNFRLPLLVLMGDADPVADPVGAHDFYDRASSPDKQFHLFPQLLHELLREMDREQLFQQILAWMEARRGGGEGTELPPFAQASIPPTADTNL